MTALEDRGAENAAVRLASGLERTGAFSAAVLALKEGSGRLYARARAAGLASVSSLGLASVLSLRDAVAAVRRAVAAREIDVLYSFLFHPNVVARLAGRGRNDLLVINGERSMPGARMAPRSLLRRWTARLPDGYTAVSDAVRLAMVDVLGVPPEKVRTIRNGVDIAAIPASAGVLDDPRTARLLSVGALSPEKSFDTLIDALARLGEPGATLTIVGDGIGRRTLEERIRAAGLGDRVRLPGHEADIRPRLAAADVYVQSSRREGLSNALLAAMAAGLPAVATDVGGTREAVEGGRTGLLVPPGDPAALAAAIRTLIERPQEARRMGAAGRSRVEAEFSAERELGETVAWIEELLRRRARA